MPSHHDQKSKKLEKVDIYLPPQTISEVERKIPAYGTTRSEAIRHILANWAEEQMGRRS